MNFHVEPETVDLYQTHQTDRVTSASIESHLMVCDICRDRLTADSDLVDRTWRGILEEVEPGVPGPLERGLRFVRVPGHIARLVAVSPHLRLSFALGVIFAVLFALTATTTDRDGPAHVLFMLIAPLLPVAGVALAYGRSVDPVFEMTSATPISPLRLLLLRASSVLVFSIGISLLVWPLVPAPSSFGVVAWLLPAMTLTVLTIALASRFDVTRAGIAVISGWGVAVLLPLSAGNPLNGTDLTAVHLVLLLAAATVIAARRHSYEREGSGR